MSTAFGVNKSLIDEEYSRTYSPSTNINLKHYGQEFKYKYKHSVDRMK